MPYHLFSVIRLSEPLMFFYKLDPWEQISVKYESNYSKLQPEKSIWKYGLQDGGHFNFAQSVNG